MSGQYLVARYIPDLERREPKNIGVIVWTPGGAVLRYLPPERTTFVQDQENYLRWMAYWQELVSQRRIQLFADRPVTNKTPRFLKAIRKTQHGNYRLDVGGEVAVNGDLDRAAEFLFDRLVASVKSRANSPTLREKCDAILDRSGISSRDDFRKRFPVILDYRDFRREIHFDYGLGNGSPKLLFSRVSITNENSVTLAAGKCDIAAQMSVCDRDACYSFFDSGGEDVDLGSAIQFLGEFSVPVDLSNPKLALMKLLRMP